jgi:hypothetical protein
LRRSPRRLAMGITGTEHGLTLTYEQGQKKCRYAPADWVFARRPVGSLFITARVVPVWRLFKGAARTLASAPRLRRFSPTGWDKRCAGSDGGGEEASSVRSRAARMRDLEGPGSAIVVVARREMRRLEGQLTPRVSRVVLTRPYWVSHAHPEKVTWHH